MKIMLSDSSVLLNLLATDRLAGIAEAAGWQLTICPAVRDETKKLRDRGSGEMQEIDITPLIASGLLQVLDLSGDVEAALYVDQASVVDDGEAMCIAMAGNRRLDLAMDDKQAANHARKTFPDLRLWSTPEILKKWSESGGVDAASLGDAIRMIEFRSRYFPAKSHPLAGWWCQSKSGS